MLEAMSFSLKNILLPGASALIVGFLCNLVRLYIRSIKDQSLRELLERLVNAAEQIYGPGEGPAKYEYVVRQAQQRGHWITRPDIEAAVYHMNSEKGDYDR